MIRLFESTATDFTTNGLGFLPDAISCNVVEERNGSFELEMEYPITGKRYEEIMTRRLLVAKSNPYADPQPFRIYEITKPFKGKVSVYAEHISYDLIGIPLNPFSASNLQTALLGLKNNAVIPCPFNFSSDKTTVANYTVPFPTNIRSELAGVEGSILDTYRGEYEFDGYNVYLWNNRGMNRGVTIRYGKNLTDLEQDENISDLYTGVLPYWYSDMENGGLVKGNIVNCEGSYNFRRILVLDCSYDFEEKPTITQLTNRAKSYITENNIGIPKVSIEISFVNLPDSKEFEDLAALTTVHLCDTVAVDYVDLGVRATGKCIKTDYNVLDGSYNSIVIGDAKPSFTSTLASNNDKLAENFQKKLVFTNDMSTEEFEKKLNDTYKDLVGDITQLETDLVGDITQLETETNGKINNLGQKVEGDIDNLGRQMNAADQKLKDDLVQADKDLKLLIKQTAEQEATKREEAIANSTKLITGNLGGYVILHSSTNADYPDEILVMDTDKITTAKKIWRWNKSGLGYSKDGYNGPYGLAITQDGSIVANYIQTGALNASLITTGHMSASIIQGGVLILGGKDNGNGTFILRDDANNVIGLMSNSGFTINKGSIAGPTITVGGFNNSTGIIKVLDSSGQQSGIWDNLGIELGEEGRLITVGTIPFDGSKVPGYSRYSGSDIFIRRTDTDAIVYFQSGSTVLDYVTSSGSNVYKNGYGFYTAEDYLVFGRLTYYESTDSISLYDVFNIPTKNVGSSYATLKSNLEVDGGEVRIGRSAGNKQQKLAFTSSSYYHDVSVTTYNNTNIQINANTTRFVNVEDADYAPIEALAFNTPSSRRYKKNIQEMTEEEANKLLEITSVTFDYIKGNDGNKRGVIAEDVYPIIPSVVSLNEDGEPEAVDYSKFVPYLIKIVQIQQKQINQLLQERKE